MEPDPRHKATSLLHVGKYSEEAVAAAARKAREDLGCDPTCAFFFVSSDYIPFLEDAIEVVRLEGHASDVFGCTASGLAAGSEELELRSGFSLMFLSLADTKLVTGCWDLAEVENGQLDVPDRAKDCSGWIILSNPFIFDTEQWLSLWNRALPHNVTIGGLASGGNAGNEVALFHNKPIERGAIGIGFEGPVRLGTLVSQGCRPIGDPLTITRAQGNILLGLGGQPAYEVLQHAWEELGENEKVQAQGNLFAGIASSEYVEEFSRGDFLVRNILGADPKTGAVAIGGFPRVGQTLQYQLRDPHTAHEDLVEISESVARKGPKPFASLLFTCTGRGSALFGQKGHDAEVLQQRLGAHPMAGFFCNGEVGPVAGQTYLHGYTASVALFY